LKDAQPSPGGATMPQLANSSMVGNVQPLRQLLPGSAVVLTPVCVQIGRLSLRIGVQDHKPGGQPLGGNSCRPPTWCEVVNR